MTLAIPVTLADAFDLPAPSKTVVTAVDAQADTGEFGRVLVCDDNALNRNVALRQLRALGYTADAAGDGLEALHKWETDDYALILLDCHMPQLNGYEVAQRIRAAESDDAHRGRTTILAYTANVVREDRERCFAAGMDDIVSKPAGLQTLRETLRIWRVKRAGPEALANATDKTPQSAADRNPDAGRRLIDWACLKEISGGDAQFERDILLGFVAEKKTDIRAILEQLPAGDLAKVAQLAHRVKGAARTAAVTDLAALCEELEALARVGDREAAAALRNRVEQTFNEIRAYIERRYS
jgi:CheY-like chemotaxis protein